MHIKQLGRPSVFGLQQGFYRCIARIHIGAQIFFAIDGDIGAADARAVPEVAQHAGCRFGGFAQIALCTA